MKKLINIISFILNIYAFKLANQEIDRIFERRLRTRNEIVKESIYEQVLSNYYCYENKRSKKYYLEKNGAENYKDFIYFIIALDDDDFLEYANKANAYHLDNNVRITKLNFFRKLEILFGLIFILGIILSFYLNNKYTYH